MTSPPLVWSSPAGQPPVAALLLAALMASTREQALPPGVTAPAATKMMLAWAKGAASSRTAVSRASKQVRHPGSDRAVRGLLGSRMGLSNRWAPGGRIGYLPLG